MSTAAESLSRFALCSVVYVGAISASLYSLALGFSDLEFRVGSRVAVETAARLSPGNATYLAQRAVLTESRDESIQSLEAAVRKNPYYSWAWIQLGLEAESQGHREIAEKDLLLAAATDHGLSPRWALCGYYLRTTAKDRFWEWCRQAIVADPGDARAEFRLCFRMDPNVRTILDRAVPSDTTSRHKFLKFVIDEQQARTVDLAEVPSLLGDARKDDLPALTSYLDRMITPDTIDRTLLVWNSMCQQRLVPFDSIIDGKSENRITNPMFSTYPSGVGFDWRLTTADWLASEIADNHSLVLRLSGRQPEELQLLSQLVPVQRGRRYEFHFRSQFSKPLESSGLRWVVHARSASGETLASSGIPGDAEIQFLNFSSAGNGLIVVGLEYQRPRGVARQPEDVTVSDLSLRATDDPQSM